MCGIVGAVAQRDVVPILIEGLRRLEYRGYDSAGVAVLIAVGPLSRETARGARASGLSTSLECDDAETAVELVRKHARPGDVVLVKASRGMRLERVVTRLLEPR